MNRKSFIKTALLGGLTSLTAAFKTKPKTIKFKFDKVEYATDGDKRYPRLTGVELFYKGKTTNFKSRNVIFYDALGAEFIYNNEIYTVISARVLDWGIEKHPSLLEKIRFVKTKEFELTKLERYE